MKQQQDKGRRQRIYRVIVAVAGVLFISYVIKGALLYTFQRKVLYEAPGTVVGAPAAYGLRNVEVTEVKTEDGLRLRAWFAPPAPHKPVILYFHGNADSLIGGATIVSAYQGKGYGVFLCEYRGYSGNPGSPTEQGLYVDARGCLQWLNDRGYGMDRIILYGESLGTGVAVQMAAEKPPKLLILESPYTSIPDAAQQVYPLYPANLLVKDRFDSIDKISKIHVPLLVIHGDEDNVIPFAMGHRLFEAANNPKTFIRIPDGGHGNLYLFHLAAIINKWLTAQMGVVGRN